MRELTRNWPSRVDKIEKADSIFKAACHLQSPKNAPMGTAYYRLLFKFYNEHGGSETRKMLALYPSTLPSLAWLDSSKEITCEYFLPQTLATRGVKDLQFPPIFSLISIV